ncbi:MAG: hypothetical protein HOC91_01745 [Nitrospinaceae bacterium]|jgi:hypothetical protein|nr:hypothetical protein [Nitrospinaceae bacterium]MBT3435595.1 hypothetical protein [Nitrospinaceae bacterium]MBT3823236.1 hypothetical protein [Nitrospinaceae bacterium]MBT4094421.1 hypothetical protein [Nitrospinaceae bacterium]MBT4429216.1 hypothetical protein [Nitrospinaceae bacterium]
MAGQNNLSPQEQSALTQRLQEWIEAEKERGIPLESILVACGECGIVPLPLDPEDENPIVSD